MTIYILNLNPSVCRYGFLNERELRTMPPFSETTVAEALQGKLDQQKYRPVGQGAIVEGRIIAWLDQDLLQMKLPELPSRLQKGLKPSGSLPVRRLVSMYDRAIEIPGEERAGAFGESLSDQLESAYDFKISEDVANTHSATDVCVPVKVAREGQQYIMAYLAAHGFDNTQISKALDVDRKTVKVSLSKFKS